MKCECNGLSASDKRLEVAPGCGCRSLAAPGDVVPNGVKHRLTVHREETHDSEALSDVISIVTDHVVVGYMLQCLMSAWFGHGVRASISNRVGPE